MYAPYAGAAGMLPYTKGKFTMGNFVHRVYPIELEMKDTTHTDKSASYLNLQLEIDDEIGTHSVHLITNPVISRE
jgi:hypothetical protein